MLSRSGRVRPANVIPKDVRLRYSETANSGQALSAGMLGMQSGDITADQLLADPASLYSDNPPWDARIYGDGCGRYNDWGLVSCER